MKKPPIGGGAAIGRAGMTGGVMRAWFCRSREAERLAARRENKIISKVWTYSNFRTL